MSICKDLLTWSRGTTLIKVTGCHWGFHLVSILGTHSRETYLTLARKGQNSWLERSGVLRTKYVLPWHLVPMTISSTWGKFGIVQPSHVHHQTFVEFWCKFWISTHKFVECSYQVFSQNKTFSWLKSMECWEQQQGQEKFAPPEWTYHWPRKIQKKGWCRNCSKHGLRREPRFVCLTCSVANTKKN